MITYTLLGRLIKDAEMTTDKKGNAYTKFTVVIDAGNDKTKLYTCYLHGNRVQKLHQYLLKGRQVLIVGTPSWRDYNGTEYESVMVSTLEFCGSKADIKPENPDKLPYTSDGRYFATREELEKYEASKKSPDGLAGPETFDEGDDIPF